MIEPQVGFVFKVDDKLFITEYSDGQFSDGYPIDNGEPYKELKKSQLAFVEMVKSDITDKADVAYVLKDHGFYTLSNDCREGVEGYEILLEMECRDELCKFIENLKESIGKNNYD